MIKIRLLHFLEKGNKYGSKGGKIFLLKWGITIKFFRKYYLRANSIYKTELTNPKKNLIFLLELLVCKLKFFYLKLIN